MREILAALARAISAALAGSWRLIDGIWTWVRSAISPAPEPVFEGASACHAPDVAEVDVAAGIKGWAQARALGRDARLPIGISPAAGGWAARLGRTELERVAASDPARIRAHLDGRGAIAGVRPAVVVVDEEAEKAKRLAALRARGASLRAAVDRSLAASAERAAAPAM